MISLCFGLCSDVVLVVILFHEWKLGLLLLFFKALKKLTK